MIKRNRTWKNRSMPDYSQASRCTTDRLHVSLRPVTFCHGVLRSTRFITAHYVSHFRRDCRGRFLNCQKICHGVHGYPGVLRLPIPFPCVASRLSRFAHGCLKRGRRDHREHSVNAVLPSGCEYMQQCFTIYCLIIRCTNNDAKLFDVHIHIRKNGVSMGGLQ